jgi:hypothetical protein
MSRRDLRLNNVPTMRTATLLGTGELIPRNGDDRIAITDISHNGYRPVLLRQSPLAGNVPSGIIGEHFLGIPVSGSSNFKSPVISDAGVSIYNATDSSIEGSQNPVTEKVLVSANYYYFRQNGSYFDNTLRLRIKFSVTSSVFTKQEMESKWVRFNLAAGEVILTQTGFGITERTVYEIDGSSLFNSQNVAFIITSNTAMTSAIFKGSSQPFNQSSAYPNGDVNGALRYWISNYDQPADTEIYGDISFYKDDLEYGIQYGVGEILLDVTVVI